MKLFAPFIIGVTLVTLSLCSTIYPNEQTAIYSAPSGFYRPFPSYLYSSSIRTTVEISSNNLFSFSLITGSTYNADADASKEGIIINYGSFIAADKLYCWGTTAADRSRLLLLQYDAGNLGLTFKTAITGSDLLSASNYTQSTLCTVFDSTNNIAYVSYLKRYVLSVNTQTGAVQSVFDLTTTLDPTLSSPLTTTCDIDVGVKTAYFMTSSGTTNNLLVLDISNPSSMSSKGYISVPGTQFVADTNSHTAIGYSENLAYMTDGVKLSKLKIALASSSSAVFVDKRDGSIFFFIPGTVVGPISSASFSSGGNAAGVKLPEDVTFPVYHDVVGCAVIARSANTFKTYEIPIVLNGDQCTGSIGRSSSGASQFATFIGFIVPGILALMLLLKI
ncbi:DNA-directed RNA polymerase III subunit RPC1 [Acrasis kona]|uniref:DNA-directed RNA polymerase III subunit RPC1 n=1 Tax=Acrasis kona TaxID=1008807 RepID=A0AAW2YXA9_9EUKA